MKNVRNVEEKTLSDELKSTILVNELKAETIKWREKNTHNNNSTGEWNKCARGATKQRPQQPRMR